MKKKNGDLSVTVLPEGIKWNRRLRPGDKTPIRLMVSEKAYASEPYPSRGPAKEKGAAPRHKDWDGRS